MSLLQACQLPFSSGTQLLLAINHLTWPILLDSDAALTSSNPTAMAGRFSIAAAAPSQQLKIYNQNQLAELEQLRPLKNTSLVKESAFFNNPKLNTLPFIGGWLGYWSYDAGRLFEEQQPQQAKQDLNLPLICMGYYDWALVTDHSLQETWLVGEFSQQLVADITQRLNNKKTCQANSFKITQPFVSNLSYADYLTRFEQVQAYKQGRIGDIYA